MDSQKTNRPPVGVVIVNHNLKDSLRETLKSFKAVNYPALQIVVSDNASTDGAQEMVRTEFPDVHLLAHKEEQGYARAASLGMAYLADKTKYIFSTTNDVTVDPEILNVLVDYAEKNPQAGVMGTRIYFFDRPDVLWHAGGSINPLHGHTRHFGWERKDNPRYAHVRECDYVTGCGYLLRSDVLKRIGYFKEDLVFYSEDAELCYRFRDAGYKVMYIPDAKMWHKTGTTLAKNRPVQLQYSTRNQLYLLQHYRVGFYPLTLWVHLLIVSPIKMLMFAVIGRGKNSIGIYRGIRDWWRGKYGWIR
ncbi:MAG TPA: glycosyltransferase family 2 protein [Verrucomicrobiae bacterium]|nr:glycosyltransferase family 2 protein [Verrucomicrobiae bacterium]